VLSSDFIDRTRKRIPAPPAASSYPERSLTSLFESGIGQYIKHQNESAIPAAATGAPTDQRSHKVCHDEEEFSLEIPPEGNIIDAQDMIQEKRKETGAL
jgi:hypothetical protein